MVTKKLQKKITTKGRVQRVACYWGGAVSGWVICEETPIHPIFRRFSDFLCPCLYLHSPRRFASHRQAANKQNGRLHAFQGQHKCTTPKNAKTAIS